jgi:hypothetical protein
MNAIRRVDWVFVAVIAADIVGVAAVVAVLAGWGR